MKSIDQLRTEIDQIHLQMNNLLLQRLQLAEQIWQIKNQLNLNFTDLQREEQMLAHFVSSVDRQNEKDFLKKLHSEIILQSKLFLTKKMETTHGQK